MTEPGVSRQVSEIVTRAVTGLFRGYARDEGQAVARLARLRDARGRPLGTDPETWWVFERIPEPIRGTSDRLNRSESAIFASLGLFALHQQSRRELSMHKAGEGLGAAVRKLAPPGSDDVAVRRRFQALGSAQDLSAVSVHMGGLVSQLRNSSLPLDYGSLAADLYQLQAAASRDGVRQRWARQFYASRTDPHPPDASSADTPEKDS